MTSKERVFATMNFQPVDRPAAFPLEGSAWICRKNNLSYEDMYKLPDRGAQLLVDGFNEMESDVLFVGGSGWMAWANTFGSEVHADVVGAPVEVGPAFKDPENEIPDLTNDEIREKLLGNYFVQAMLEQIRNVKAIAGDEKPLMCGHDGPITAAAMFLGVQPFLKAVAKNSRKPQPYLPRLIEFSARCVAVYAGLLVEAGCDILNMCDPVASGDMMSPVSYEQLGLPALDTYKANLKYPNHPLLVHICGAAGSRVEHIVNFGIARFFSVDSMVDMEDMLKKCDHKVVMVGNINPAQIMLQGTPEQVYNEATALLELGKKNGGGIVPCTGCELPSASPLENILALSRAAKDFAARA